MSDIWTPFDDEWEEQPQEVVGIASGVIIATSSPGVSSRCELAPQSGIVVSPGPRGLAYQFTANTHYVTVSKYEKFTSHGFTIVFVAKAGSSTVLGQSLFQILGTSGSNNKIEIYHLNAGQVRADIFNPSGAATTIDTNYALVANESYVYALQVSASGQTSCAISGVVNSGATMTRPNDCLSTYTIGGRANNTFGLSGSIYAHVIANDSVDIGSVTRNPWQLFAPIEKTIWAPASAAAPFTPKSWVPSFGPIIAQ